LNQNLLDSRSPQSLTVIADIASEIEIQADFTIAHPRYLPLIVPVAVVTSLQQLPATTQDNYRRLQLQNFLYGAYFSGSSYVELATPVTTDPPQAQHLENNTARGLNIEFDRCLRQHNCGTGFFDPGWQITEIDRDGHLQVTKDCLTLSIVRERHLSPTQRSATIGDTVEILMPSNTIDDLYYVAIGDGGKAENSQMVAIYFNVSTEGAVALMKSITTALNQLKLPFTFKVLHDPANCEACYDATILTINCQDYCGTEPLLRQIYQLNQSYFKPAIPAFTKLLAPGLSIAELPDCPDLGDRDFGQHCCQIISDALLSARQQNDESSSNRQLLIRQFFARQGLAWEQPYLSFNSDNSYPLFD
jgi:HopA1 effector protein family